MKDIRGRASVLDTNPKSTVGGGVKNVYDEDCATEHQLVTPWIISVIRLISFFLFFLFFLNLRLMIIRWNYNHN